MRYLRIILVVFLLMGMCGTGFCAAPTIEESNRLQFTAADQETTMTFRITSVIWVSAAGAEIAATHGYLLEDGSGAVICGAEATALTDHQEINFGKGITVSGLKAEDLDGGYLYVFGQRR